MARAAADAAEEELDINSPSRVAYRIGSFFGVGFINGISEYEKSAYEESKSLAEYARMGLQKAIHNIQNVLCDEIDLQPTIRPILDLSDIDSKARGLNALFSRDQAVMVNGEIENVRSGRYRNDGHSNPLSNVYTFTQNNYSPKSLSRTEIYRQTRNQFSMLERMAKI